MKYRYLWAAVVSFSLAASTSFVMLDTFVLPKSLTAVTTASGTAASSLESTSSSTTENTGNADPVITDNSYQSDQMTITIKETRVENTKVFLADITVSDPSLLKAALAQDTYGRNIKEKTSVQAANHNAVLAINGDYYGFRNSGYVIRNGTLYRDTASEDSEQEDLMIDQNGDFSIIKESEVTAAQLVEENAQQVFSFGPALVIDGETAVSAGEEVGQATNSNPRTAIGQIGKNHYLVVVSEGRTSDSEGLSLDQLATVLKDNGVTTGYNLDGGGSTTLYFNEKVLNETVGGRGESERSVSDIVYFG